MKNLPKNITQKQIEYIEFIENFASVQFDGDKMTISEFITRHKEAAHLASLDAWDWDYL